MSGLKFMDESTRRSMYSRIGIGTQYDYKTQIDYLSKIVRLYIIKPIKP